MINNKFIISKISSLPEELKSEVLDFVEYINKKHKDRIQRKFRKTPKFGSCKGLFIIPNDFDEPLEDFKDYM